MGKKHVSELVKLIRGEGGGIWLSSSERTLLKFSLDTFGEWLSQFLLAGFGEDNVSQRWKFVITFTGEDNTQQKRQLQVITHEPLDGSSCLPRGRDPLVLLALLHLLLHGRRRTDYVLIFREEDILKLLGWEDTDEVRSEIDDALYRYCLLMYQWEMSRSELIRSNLSYYTANGHALSEYRTLDKQKGEDDRAQRVYSSVKLSELFVRGLIGRSLFHVEWDKVKSLSRPQALSRVNE